MPKLSRLATAAIVACTTASAVFAQSNSSASMGARQSNLATPQIQQTPGGHDSPAGTKDPIGRKADAVEKSANRVTERPNRVSNAGDSGLTKKSK